MVRLSDLVKRFGGKLSHDAASGWAGDPLVSDVELDSRRITPGCLFAALAGGRTNGAEYASSALGSGAAAVLARTAPGSGWQGSDCSALWLHSNPRRVAGLAAGFVRRGQRQPGCRFPRCRYLHGDDCPVRIQRQPHPATERRLRRSAIPLPRARYCRRP